MNPRDLSLTLSFAALVALAGAGVAAAEETPPAFASPTIEPLIRMGLFVAVLGAVAWGLSRWARSRQIAKGGDDARIDVLAVRNLGPRHRVAVVEVGHRRFLLGLGGEAISSVAELTDPIRFSETLDGLGTGEDDTQPELGGIGRFEGLDG